METITLRNIGKEIGNFFSDLGTAILDFDLSYIFPVIAFLGIPIFMYFSLAKFIRNYKEHHIVVKIVYPIAFLGIAYIYTIALSVAIESITD